MPVQDFGTPIIQAYLHGKQLRNQEEQQRAAREMAQKKLEEDIRQFNEQLKETQNVHKATLAHQDSQAKLAAAHLKLAGLEAVSKGLIPVSQETQPVGTSEQAAQDLNVNTFRAPGGQTQPIENPNFTSFRQVKQPLDLGAGVTIPGEQLRTPEELGQETLAKTLPELKAKSGFRLAEQVAKYQADLAKDLKVEETRQKGRMDLQGLKHTDKLSEIEKQGLNIANAARLRAGLRQPRYLSPDDAMKLGVPYGMTQDEAAKLQLTPQKPITAQEQSKLNALVDLRNQYQELMNLGEKTGFNAHVPGVGNLVGRFKASFPGGDSPEMIDYRSKLGAVTAEELHKKYGSVLSAGEMQRAAQFIPELSNDKKVAASRIANGLKNVNKLIDETIKPTVVRGGTNITSETSPAPTLNRGGHVYIWDGSKYVLSGKAQ